MARIRSIKPELRESLVVASWPFEVRYFLVLLLGYFDDRGRGLDLSKRIAGDCFPHDDISAEDIDKWLDLMTQGIDGRPGPICRYEVAGRKYIHSVNWSEHQRPNRPTPSRLPPCTLHESLTEPPLSNSVPGAGEQGSRGAEEQQRTPRESLTDLPAGAEIAASLVMDATACTSELAAEVVLLIARKRKPRKLVPYVRTLIAAHELGEWFTEAQRNIEHGRAKQERK